MAPHTIRHTSYKIKVTVLNLPVDVLSVEYVQPVSFVVVVAGHGPWLRRFGLLTNPLLYVTVLNLPVDVMSVEYVQPVSFVAVVAGHGHDFVDLVY